MSEIWQFFLDNYQNLKLSDYVFLTILGGLAVVGSWVIVRRFYRARYQAQGELLTLRESTIESLRRQRDVLLTEQTDMEQRLSLTLDQLQALDQDIDGEPDSEPLRPTVSLLKAEAAILMTQYEAETRNRSSIAYIYVYLLEHSGNSQAAGKMCDMVWALDDELDRVSKRLRGLIEDLDAFTDPTRELHLRPIQEKLRKLNTDYRVAIESMAAELGIPAPI